MTVWLGNYAVATDDGAAYTRQRDAIKTAIQKYGVEHIGGLTVGNEFILKYASPECFLAQVDRLGTYLVTSRPTTRQILMGL
jgi:hypothetical protein